MPAERLTQLLARIDQLNRDDPNTESVDGAAQPRELAYSQRLSEWVRRLRPGASEELTIAARGQHIKRWTIPRTQYPMDRRGYLRWREALKTFHIDTVAGLMREAGYPDAAIQRVREIMGKRNLQDDPESQTLEDALCLIFFESQLGGLRAKTPEEKMGDVIRKVWKRMSEQGRAEVAKLPLSADERAALTRALESG